jgi:transcriptional regulator
VSNKPRSKAEVLQGTLDLMVLQTLDSLGPLHGYAIAARLEQVSGGALQLNMGTLYPALMRLEQRGLLRGKWGTTETNRKARFYAVTSAGRRQLAREKRAGTGWRASSTRCCTARRESGRSHAHPFANGFSVFRERCFQAGATPTWNTSSGRTWKWPQRTRDVVVSTPTMLRAPRGLRREALRKPWTRSGISEACRGWTTWRAT